MSSKPKKSPKCFDVQVDITKVNLDVIHRWIEEKINEQLPDEDILVDYLYELLQAGENQHPDIRAIHTQLTDFLGESESLEFCKKLWKLLISAQDDLDGIPAEILEKRRKEFDELESKRKLDSNQKKSKSDSDYNQGQHENPVKSTYGHRDQRNQYRSNEKSSKSYSTYRSRDQNDSYQRRQNEPSGRDRYTDGYSRSPEGKQSASDRYSSTSNAFQSQDHYRSRNDYPNTSESRKKTNYNRSQYNASKRDSQDEEYRGRNERPRKDFGYNKSGSRSRSRSRSRH